MDNLFITGETLSFQFINLLGSGGRREQPYIGWTIDVVGNSAQLMVCFMNWLDEFKEKTQCTDGKFGHNTEFHFLPHFKKLDKMGVKIKIVDYYSIEIILSWISTLQVKNSFDAVMYILTKLPGASKALYDKNKLKLYLEWHY